MTQDQEIYLLLGVIIGCGMTFMVFVISMLKDILKLKRKGSEVSNAKRK